MGRLARLGWCASSWRTTSSRPTRITLDGELLGRLNRSFDFGFGGVSPPMASTAMVSMGDAERLLFDDLDHFAALVFSAMRANAVREFGLMAIGALRQPGRFSES